MLYLLDIVHFLLPLLSFILLIIGIKTKYKYYVSIALWLSLTGVVIHYLNSGGEILGTYFNYINTVLYTCNLMLLLVSLIYLLWNLTVSSTKKRVCYINSFVSVIAVVSVLILLVNVWMNAYFIENKRPGTPVFQVARFEELDYCSYKYVFYRINKDNTISYLCPNRFLLLPVIGNLQKAPWYFIKHLPPQLQNQFLTPTLGKMRTI